MPSLRLRLPVVTCGGEELAVLEARGSWRLQDVLERLPEPSALVQQRILLGSQELQGPATLAELGAKEGSCLTLLLCRRSCLLTASSDGTARLWCGATGSCLRCFRGHGGQVTSARFSPQERLILTSSGDGTAKLWCTDRAACVRTLDHGSWVHSACFSPDDDGSEILTTSGRRDVQLWHAGSGNRLRGFAVTGSVTGGAFSPDGQLIAATSEKEGCFLFSRATGELLRKLAGDRTAMVWCAAFSPDGAKMLTGSSDGSATLWSVASGECLEGLPRLGAEVTCIAFAPDGELLLLGDGQGRALLFRGNGDLVRSWQAHGSTVWAVAFSSDGQQLATAGSEELRIWSADSDFSCLRSLAGHGDAVLSVAFSRCFGSCSGRNTEL